MDQLIPRHNLRFSYLRENYYWHSRVLFTELDCDHLQVLLRVNVSFTMYRVTTGVNK